MISSIILEGRLCQSDSNLLFSSDGVNNSINIYDQRVSKIVKSFDGIHSGSKFFFRIFLILQGKIKCVRWEPSGDFIASASDDKTAKVIYLKTEKVTYTGNTADGSNLFLY